MNTDDEGRPCKANDGESGESLVEDSGQENLEDWIDEASEIFGDVELIALPEPPVKLSKVIHKKFDQPFSEWLNENIEKYGRALLTSPDTLIPRETKEETKEEKPVIQEKPSWESLQKQFRAIENEYFDCVNHWRDAERCKRAEKRYSQALEALEKYKRLYGLVVLHANDDGKQTKQHGWPSLYFPINKLNISKRYKAIQAIRGLTENKVYEIEWNEEGKKVFRLDEKGKKIPGYEPKVKIPLIEKRLWLFEHNIIDEIDIYAWFYDLVWRQNNQGVLIETEQGRKVIENFSGRWNKKRPFGYQVRERLRGILEEIRNPLHLVLSISDEKIFPLMPYNTNLDVVIFSILNIGKWIREFLQRLYHYQERRNIDWQFKGWVLEFQGEKEDTAERSYLNRGFPHPHLIFAGNWLGKIQEIQDLWPYGRVDLTTVKDIQKRRPGIKLDGLRLANYLTKYVSKASRAITDAGVHKGYAWLTFSGGRIFSVKHKKRGGEGEC